MGAMDARNMYSNLAVNKYLHTVASCWISSAYFDGSCREIQYTHFVFKFSFLLQPYRLRDNVEIYCRAGQATDGNKAHTFRMLGTEGYKHTHSEYVILFSTAKMIRPA